MKTMSKIIVKIPRRYLIRFNAPPNGLSPHAIALTTPCSTDNVPPVKSQRILKILHPSVLPRL